MNQSVAGMHKREELIAALTSVAIVLLICQIPLYCRDINVVTLARTFAERVADRSAIRDSRIPTGRPPVELSKTTGGEKVLELDNQGKRERE